MPRITFLPEGKSITVRSGTTLLAAARQASVGVRTRCGGVAGCLMCKVKVMNQDALSPPSKAERRKMGGETNAGVRLSCQTRALDDVTVEVPEDPLKAAVRRQLERQKEEEGLW